MSRVANKLTTLVVYINTRNGNLAVVWQIIKIFNILVFLLKLLKETVLANAKGSGVEPYFRAVYAGLEGRSVDGLVYQQIAYVLTAMLAMVCLCMGYYLCSNTNIMDSAKKTNLILFCLNFPILTLILIQLLYPSAILYLLFSYEYLSEPNNGHTQATHFFTSMTTILVLIVTAFNYRNRVFGILFPFMMIALQVFSGVTQNLMVICASLFFAWTDRQLISCCGYASFIVGCLFLILDSFKHEESIASLIHLGCSLLFSQLVVIGTMMYHFKLGTHQQCNQFLINIVSELDRSDPGTLSSQQMLQVEQIFRKFTQKNELTLPPQFIPLVNKRVAQLTYQQLLLLVDTKLQTDSRQNNHNLGLQKQLLTFRIHNSYSLNESIFAISEFMSGYDVDLTSSQEKLIRKELELTVFQYFQGKESENEKLRSMVLLSQVQQQFIDQSMSLLTNINSFWQEVNMDVLIEEYIEDSFYKVAQGMAQLKKLLKILKKGYRACWQTKVLDMLTKLMYASTPNNINSQIELPNPEIQKDSLLFFIVRNRKIVHVSPTLLKVINCTAYETAGEGIGKIMPADLGVSVEGAQDEEAVKSDKSSGTVMPVICGPCLVKVFEIDVKLQPKTDEGIQFYYILQKLQEEQKKAYIYISTVDLSIRFVSQQFYQIFVLNSSLIEPKMVKKQLFLNALIPTMQANKILPELHAKKSIRTIISMHSLRSKKSIYHQNNKFNGLINLQNSFDKFVLISVQISNLDEEKQMSSDNRRMKSILGVGILNNTVLLSDYLDIPEASKNSNKISIKNSASPLQTEKQRQGTQQQVFCPISNPYKQKIEEKQAQISQQSRAALTYSSCSISLSVILLLLLVAASSLSLYHCWHQSTSIDTLVYNIGLTTGHSNNLIHGTFEIYSQHILSARSQEIQSFIDSINSTISIPDYLALKYSHIHRIIADFQHNFTKFYDRQIFASTQYQILYTYMTISTNLSKSSLMEYVFNLKLASDKINILYNQSLAHNVSFVELESKQRNPLLFISQNYPIISAIESPYTSLPALIEVLRKGEQVVLIAILAICVLCVLIVYAIIHGISNNLSTIRSLFQMFAMIDRKEINRIFTQIDGALGLYKSQVPRDSLHFLSNLSQAGENTMAVYSSKVRESKKHMNYQYEEIREQEDSAIHKLIESNKKIPHLHALLTFKLLLIIIVLFFGTLGGCFYKMQVDFGEDRVNLSYLCEIERLRYGELKNSADMFHYYVLNHVFRVPATPPQEVRDKRSSVDKFESGVYIQQFQQFYQKQNYLLKQSLCDVEIIDDLFLDSLIDCKQVGLGILQKGYIQAAQYYDFLTHKIIQGEIDPLQIGQSQKYMNLFIHIYVREKLLAQFAKFRQNVLQNKARLSQKYKWNMICFGIVFALITVGLAAYLLLKFVPDVMRIKKVGIGYFRILPKETLATIKISSYISDNDLLQKVGLM